MEAERSRLARQNASGADGGLDSAKFGPFDFPIDFCDHLFGFTIILTPQARQNQKCVHRPDFLVFWHPAAGALSWTGMGDSFSHREKSGCTEPKISWLRPLCGYVLRRIKKPDALLLHRGGAKNPRIN